MGHRFNLEQLEEWDPTAPDNGADRKRFLCPLCGQDKPRDAGHRSLSVQVKEGYWRCHRCGQRGKMTRERSSIKFAAPTAPPKSSPTTEMLAAFEEYVGAFPSSPAAFYLMERGVSEDVAVDAGCGFAFRWPHDRRFTGRDGKEHHLVKYSQRVVFPVRDQQGALIAIQGRIVTSGEYGPKAMTAGPKSLGIFATARARDVEPVIVTEAPIDALSLAEAGFPAIATLGTSCPEWLPRACLGADVWLATDADDAGDAFAEKLGRLFSAFTRRVRRVRPMGAKDWNEILSAVGAKGTRRMIEAAAERGN